MLPSDLCNQVVLVCVCVPLKGNRTFGHLLLCHPVCQLFSDGDVLGHAELQGFVELQNSSTCHNWNKEHTHMHTQKGHM